MAPPAGGPAGPTLSNSFALVNMLKGLFGLGILALPFATVQVGWLASAAGFAFIAVLTVWGIACAAFSRALLLHSKDTEDDRLVKKADADASSTSSFGLGFFDGVAAEAFGPTGQWITIACILMTQFATAVAYVDVIAESVGSYLPGHEVPILVVLGVFLSACSTVKTLSGVALLSAVALSTYAFIFVGLVHESIGEYQAGEFGAQAVAVKRVGFHLGTWFGLAQFSMGALPICVLIHDDMIEQQDFMKMVLIAFGITWAVFSSFAVLGYLCFGEDTAEVVYFNFESKFFHHASIISVVAILIFSYVLQMFPFYNYAQVLCSQIAPLDKLHYSGVRAILVAFSVAVAYACPNLVFILDVMGGVAGAIISFVMPALVYLKLKKAMTTFESLMCWTLVVVGCIGGLKAMGV